VSTGTVLALPDVAVSAVIDTGRQGQVSRVATVAVDAVLATGCQGVVFSTPPALIVSAALETGGQGQVGAVPSLVLIDPAAVDAFADWQRRLNWWGSTGGKTLEFTPVMVAAVGDTGGRLGDVGVSGAVVYNAGSHASAEMRWASWSADHSATLVGASSGVTYTHNLGTTNRITKVYPVTLDGTLGDVWVVRGSNSDTIYWSGSYVGDVIAVTVRATNVRSVVQGDWTITAAGKFVAGSHDLLPVAVHNADTGGAAGDLYALPVAGGWTFYCTGSAEVQARIALLL